MTDNAPKLPTPTLMLVTDRRLAGGEDALVRAVAEAVEGGVNVVQLREKDLAPADLLPLACRLREVTAGRALLLVNTPAGREDAMLDVALEAGADGVHLPEDAEPPRPPWTFVWGRSVHSEEGASMAMSEAPRYLVVGPVYETASHPGRPALGLSIIREVVPISRVPIIAIGGITPANGRDVMQAGAHGLAVISAILGSDDPRGAAKALVKSWEFVPVRKFFT
jgi:thiamine-phosphate pyrophosphorylase